MDEARVDGAQDPDRRRTRLTPPGNDPNRPPVVLPIDVSSPFPHQTPVPHRTPTGLLKSFS